MNNYSLESNKQILVMGAIGGLITAGLLIWLYSSRSGTKEEDKKTESKPETNNATPKETGTRVEQTKLTSQEQTTTKKEPTKPVAVQPSQQPTVQPSQQPSKTTLVSEELPRRPSASKLGDICPGIRFQTNNSTKTSIIFFFLSLNLSEFFLSYVFF